MRLDVPYCYALAARRIVGRRVKSTYRARWRGVVEAVERPGSACVRVVLTHDRHDRPFAKRLTRTLHVSWLEDLGPAGGAP